MVRLAPVSWPIPDGRRRPKRLVGEVVDKSAADRAWREAALGPAATKARPVVLESRASMPLVPPGSRGGMP